MKGTFICRIAASLLALALMAACAPALPETQPAAQPETRQALRAAASPEARTAAPGARVAQSAEFGITLSYPAALAQTAAIEQVAPAPLSADRMFAESHPGYVRIAFGGYALKRAYQLAYPLTAPQVMLFRTADFVSYSSSSPTDFPGARAKLAALLAGEIDPRRCAAPPNSVEDHLPYLPWTNAGQVFCAQLEKLEFGQGSAAGRGIRYLTTFSQGIEPVQDTTVFYTFQGLTDDGQNYVSAVFPVETGVFPPEPPEAPLTNLTNIRSLLAGQITTLNAKAAADFHPSLEALDAVVESIRLD